MLDRTIQPRICEPEQLAVPSPECRVMKNGIPLYILNARDNEVVRLDLDLLSCDDTVYKPDDLKRDYICRGLKEIE